MGIQYASIDVWPGKLKSSRRHAPFKSGFTSTLELLERECRAISAEGVLVKLAIGLGDLTRDGRIRADARPAHPGVIVSLRKPVQTATGIIKFPLNFPCDTFAHWEENLRAIGLGLEALRKVDRYGVTSNGEQYKGFKALPPPGPAHDGIATIEEGAAFVAAILGSPGVAVGIIREVETWRLHYRAAAAKLHPDAGNSVGDGWEKLQAAKTLLDAHHRI